MKRLLTILLICFLISCSEDEDNVASSSPTPSSERNFRMGFTSWSYGPTLGAVDSTYDFIAQNGDLYVEHIDNKIPWKAWINNQSLPTAFTNEIAGKANRKIPGKKLLLSVSLLNSARNELAEDFDGTIPAYTELDEQHIMRAYSSHINYLIQQFNPDYLVISIEANELFINSLNKWEAYKRLMTTVIYHTRLAYPTLPIAESVSLHNLYQTGTTQYQDDVFNRINQHDFIAISFYPFLKGLSTKSEFQAALNYLHNRAKSNKRIAFVETAHIAENLNIPNLNVSINGNPNEQNGYLETLLQNAQNQDYEFVVWWAHRDFDALWQTFPANVKDLGQIWRDTGILDEDGNERPAYQTWQNSFLP